MLEDLLNQVRPIFKIIARGSLGGQSSAYPVSLEAELDALAPSVPTEVYNSEIVRAELREKKDLTWQLSYGRVRDSARSLAKAGYATDYIRPFCYCYRNMILARGEESWRYADWSWHAGAYIYQFRAPNAEVLPFVKEVIASAGVWWGAPCSDEFGGNDIPYPCPPAPTKNKNKNHLYEFSDAIVLAWAESLWGGERYKVAWYGRLKPDYSQTPNWAGAIVWFWRMINLMNMTDSAKLAASQIFAAPQGGIP